MNHKISFLVKIFKNYPKITFYETMKESEINNLVFVSTVPSGKLSNGFILERGIYTEESYYKKQQILKIFKKDVVVVYSFSVLDLMNNKLDLDSITYDNPIFRRLTKKMNNGIIKTKRRR